mmetsp:Transcript_30815/g.45576  ORF Transcript_30815/g.45576 Transcript_30815/m.45576 type:complete len:403 (+) Transcript_30815:112-1320(+)|eukprot:CAMPEP_0194264002 /NCGR_PEP_ID=MMETSP0158-20130606/47362_1 /TAXON_ID=33649 /ORGANISM="Thalassionema nitzschioides, Strain L26-B" /LENGTH=402 /DNA_ID=CAMNT_0039004229 /DNA_START=98 /DNA_END=1306 /DNA_ORIENTATION=+
MPRPPTKHGLEKKFKPWRKGKSKNSKAKSSLKHQLRGHGRLLAKLSTDDSERRKEIEMKIKDLKLQIDQKNATGIERQNASKSHGIRFLERQKLVRMERNVYGDRKKVNERLLRKVALDQAYVAHFPHDIKYMPLFRKGERIVDDQRMLRRRAITRQRILQLIKNGNGRVQWISESQYNRLPTSWTLEQEEEMFGKRQTNDSNAVTEEDGLITDNRFTLNSNHEKLIEAVEMFENKGELLTDEDDRSIVKSDKCSASSDDDELDKLSSLRDKKVLTQNPSEKGSGSDSSSASTDGSGESSESSDTDDESSDSDDESSGADKGHTTEYSEKKDPLKRNFDERTIQNDKEHEDFDDFFLPDSDKNAFDKARLEKPHDLGSGDKSKGWASQRQRPGEWKKKRRQY